MRLKAEPSTVIEAARVISGGGLAIFPTDTVYGIGCLHTHDLSVERIFELKGRPAGKPFPLLASSLEQAAEFALIEGEARRAAARGWPGAVTLVLPARPGAGIPGRLCLDGGVALRVPGSDWLRAVIALAGGLLVGTSANLSGSPPAADLGEIPAALIEAVDLVVDGGRTAGRPSSVFICSGDRPTRLR